MTANVSMFGKFRFRGEGGGSGENDHEFRFLGNIEFYERPLMRLDSWIPP